MNEIRAKQRADKRALNVRSFRATFTALAARPKAVPHHLDPQATVDATQHARAQATKLYRAMHEFGVTPDELECDEALVQLGLAEQGSDGVSYVDVRSIPDRLALIVRS